MREEQFKVLKTMSEATNRMDINTFAKKVNLNPNQTIQQIQELAKEGFLQKVGGGFGITERGKVAIKAFTPVPEEMGFHFYNGMNQPTALTARTLEEFYRIIKKTQNISYPFCRYSIKSSTVSPSPDLITRLKTYVLSVTFPVRS